MSSDIGDRLERAILEEDEESLNRLRTSHDSARGAEQAFAPVGQAAEDLREKLRDLPSIELRFSHVAASHNGARLCFCEKECA